MRIDHTYQNLYRRLSERFELTTIARHWDRAQLAVSRQRRPLLRAANSAYAEYLRHAQPALLQRARALKAGSAAWHAPKPRPSWAMLPNDWHPGPRCSCAECVRMFPDDEPCACAGSGYTERPHDSAPVVCPLCDAGDREWECAKSQFDMQTDWDVAPEPQPWSLYDAATGIRTQGEI